MNAIFFLCLLICVQASLGDDVITKTNFAMGGAKAGSGNAQDDFPDAAPALALIRGGGLDIYGLDQQVDFVLKTINDVESDDDVFWVFAGANDYIGGTLDPQVSPAAILHNIERLYNESDARNFIVPNLPNLGKLPVFRSQGPTVSAGVTQLSVIHNQILAGALATFQDNHPGANVMQVDAFTIFEGLEVSGQFVNTEDACNEVITDLAVLAVPGACDDYLFLDFVHPSSASWTPVAQAAADLIHSTMGDVRRIITLGDSLSDSGTLNNLFLRTPYLGFQYPLPPFTNGRFTENANVIEQLEALASVEIASRFFPHPYSATFNVVSPSGATPIEQTFDLEGDVFVPLSVQAEVDGTVFVDFQKHGGSITRCKYKCESVDGSCALRRCKSRVQGGDLLSVDTIVVFSVDSASVNLDYYLP